MQKLIEKRLSLFWDPGTFLLPEWEGKNPLNSSKYYDLNTLLKVNQDNNIWLFFTPNGNLGKLNKTGEIIKRKQVDCEDYIASFYVDVDLRDAIEYKDHKSMLKHILKASYDNKVPIQYIVRTGNWFHLRAFTKVDERYVIGDEFAKQYKTIQESLSEIYDGWDASSHSNNKLMRLPYTQYWKGSMPVQTQLLKVEGWDKDELTTSIVETPEQIMIDDTKCLNFKQVEFFVNNMRTPEVRQQKWAEHISVVWTEQVNALSIVDVISKLKAYPRTFNWKKYLFWLKWNRITFTIDWVQYNPDGYRVKTDGNYVHNFSFDKHEIDERPRGWCFSFLYHYFNKNMADMNTFFENEFGFSLSKVSGNEMYLCLKGENGSIYFTDEWVIYHKQIKNKKWDWVVDVQSKLFDVPLVIEGVIKTPYEMHGETEEENIYYVIKRLDNEDIIIMDFMPDRKAFNKKYGKKGLVFTGSEFDILDFFMAINNAVKKWALKRFDFRYLNGYYKGTYVIGDSIFDREWNKVDPKASDIILYTNKIEMVNNQSDVTIRKFGEALRWIFSDRESMLSMATYLMLLLWHKFRYDTLWQIKQQVLLPWLFLSWKTRAGKTTLITILKNGIGLAYESRKFSVISTSPQPLKQAWCDDFILHIEEFTGDVWEVKETIIRDILNKSRSGRWQSDWTNVQYIYRSGLLIDWEKLPRSESVANRCILVGMYEQDKIGDEAKLYRFKDKTFLRDFLVKAYSIDTATLYGQLQDIERMLKDKKIKDRNLLLYSLVVLANRFFDTFPEDELIAAVLENLEDLAHMDVKNNELADILAEFIIANRVQPTLIEWERNQWQVIIPFTIDMRNKNKIEIINLLKIYKKHVQLRGNNILITVNPEDTSEQNVELYNALILYKKYFRRENFLDFV